MASAGLSPAAAQNCADAQTQRDMNICAAQRFAAADAALNTAYQALAAKISPQGRARLRSAQRAWLAYRDAECAFETAASTGGSIYPMVESNCRADLTLAQTRRLQAQAACREGDIGCGGQ